MIEVGGVYQFNQAQAYVIAVISGVVHWRTFKRQNVRKVPLWYFEKYAVAL